MRCSTNLHTRLARLPPSENLGGEAIFMAIERSTRAWEKERELRA